MDEPSNGSGSSGRSSGALRVAYLLWRYPAVSLTFVQREVAGLRRAGAEVHTMSVRPAHAGELLTETERESFRTTWTVLPVHPLRALAVNLLTLLRWPAAYTACLRHVLRAGVLGGRPRSLLYFAEAVLVAHHLRPLGIRHIHVHLTDVSAEVASHVARFERLRRPDERFTWSLTVHGPDELLRPHEHRLPDRIREADLVVTISEYARSQLMAMSDQDVWPRIHVVHCGVALDRWPHQPREAAPGPLRVLSVGRLAGQKSHEVLVAAADLLRADGVDVDVTIVGEGPSRASIEREIAERGLADRVHLVGAVGQDEVGRYFQTADVFCLASVSEGLPVVLMEAMATGLPVVTTRITGVPELVEDGVSGLLVPPGRPELLAAALARVAGDPALRASLVEAGRAAVRDGFDIRDTVAQMETLLRAVQKGELAAGTAVGGQAGQGA